MTKEWLEKPNEEGLWWVFDGNDTSPAAWRVKNEDGVWWCVQGDDAYVVDEFTGPWQRIDPPTPPSTEPKQHKLFAYEFYSVSRALGNENENRGSGCHDDPVMLLALFASALAAVDQQRFAVYRPRIGVVTGLTKESCMDRFHSREWSTDFTQMTS